jgi:hypothetical protein
MTVTGGLAGSVEWGSLIAGTYLMTVAVLIFTSRLSFAAAIPMLMYLGLLAVVPLEVELDATKVSHAMYFNRLGWISITLVFVLFLKPHLTSTYTLVADVIGLSTLLFFLFYLKLTYFMVTVAFLACLCLTSAYNRRLSLMSIVLFGAGIGVMELAYNLNGGYFRDLQMAIHASGLNRGVMGTKLFLNANELAMVAAAVVLSWNLNTAQRWFYVGFIAFVAASGLAVIDQNTQTYGIVSLLAALLASQELLRRSARDITASDGYRLVQSVKSLACLGLVLLYIIQPIVNRTASMAMIRSGVIQVQPNMPGELDGMVFAEQLWKHFCSGLVREPNTNKMIPSMQSLTPMGSTYLDSVLDGIQLLKAAGTSNKQVIVFDFVTPFSSILGMEPPRHGHTAIDYNRTMTDLDFTPPEELLGSVDYVMVPGVPVNGRTTDFLLRTYGPYLKENFEPTSETKFWTLWSRRTETLK